MVFHMNPPMFDMERKEDLNSYNFPRIDWFDFDNYRIISEAIHEEIKEFELISPVNIKPSEEYFTCTLALTSIFTTLIFLRGIDKMLMDLITNKKFAENLIEVIGEFFLEFCKKNLSSTWRTIDMYEIWDDIASQENLMLSPNLWRKYYKPWHRKIIEEIKKMICWFATIFVEIA